MRQKAGILLFAFLVVLMGLFAIAMEAGAFGFLPKPTQPYSALSADHTNYGVSQFWAGDLEAKLGNRRVQLRLWNPAHVTMRAIVLIYERVYQSDANLQDVEDLSDKPGQFVASITTILSPHASIGPTDEALCEAIDGEFSGGSCDPEPPMYVEILAVPEKKVLSNSKYFADGLGIGVQKKESQLGPMPINPSLFSLPEDVFQQNQVINKMCEIAIDLGDRNVWKFLGVHCFGGPLPEDIP